MKLVLKEFFVFEAKGDQYSGHEDGQNSSSEKDRKANEGITPNAQDKRISAAAQKSQGFRKDAKYKAKLQNRINRDSKWQDKEASDKEDAETMPTTEALQLEYEDPTSSKRSHDDSKWAGPYSDQERMPHEEPHSVAQSNSSDGWEEMRSSSQEKKGARGDVKDPGDLKKFFGGEPYPKSSSKGGKSSRKSSRKSSVDEAPDPALDPKRYPGVEPIFKGSDTEIPMGSLDDFGTGHGEDDYEHGTEQDPFAMSPQDLRKWAGADDSPIEKSHMYDQTPEQGHNPFEPNWSDTTAFNDEEPIKTSKHSGEGFDDGEDMTEASEDDEFEKMYADLQGADGPAGPQKDFSTKDLEASEPDIDWGSLDDESFLDKLAATDMGPAKHTAKGSGSAPKDDGPGYGSFDQEMTWDEFRATHPEEAAEFEGRFPTEGATFKKKKSGFIHANIGRGKQARRLFYMGDGRGWADMDDGGSPSGEF